MANQKLTSVKIDEKLWDEFKIECIKRKFSFQKLSERAIDLFMKNEQNDSINFWILAIAPALYFIDQPWKNHLSVMDYLRSRIGLRAMGQRDPLVEYQK